MSLGENLRRLRKDKQMTLLEVGERCGVTPQSVYKWEKDLAEPNMKTVSILCDLFNVTVEELAGYYTQPLTREERDLVVAYRYSSAEVKQIICSILKI